MSKMRLVDLTGKTFGRLTVVSLTEPKISPSGSRRTQWLCKCECGRERVVEASQLKRGSVTHCGYCDPLTWREKMMQKDCRWCKYSQWNKGAKEWECSKGIDPTSFTDNCSEYWCGEYDKISGVNNRKSKCYICGAPTYSHGTDTPIYCEKHRAYARQDSEALENAPYELLFSLIAGIFLRAREDYIYNSDNQRKDAEVFFQGDWAQELSLQGFDAKKALEVLNEEIKDATRRIDEDTE